MSTQLSPEAQQRLIDKVQNIHERNAVEDIAAATPLPGPAGDAFITGPIVVSGITVRKIVKMDWRVWQQTGNAIISGIVEMGKPEADRKIIQDDDSDCVSVWMLTHTCREVEEALKAGVDAFKERCRMETEQVMESHEFGELLEAVMQQITRSAMSALKYAQKNEDSPGKEHMLHSPDGKVVDRFQEKGAEKEHFFPDTGESQKMA